MSKKQKLELTWIGKDKRPRLEPRILLEDKSLSYRAHTPVKSGQADIPFEEDQQKGALRSFEADLRGFQNLVGLGGGSGDAGLASHNDNLLIHGDNLLALKALEQQYAGKVKCVFIDPPYNTGSAFTHYDDGLEHSMWLSLMRDRLEAIRTLLAEDGSLWITIDDNEAHYLKVLCDEVFGRGNFVANVVWQKKYSPGNNQKGISSDLDHVLVFTKDTQRWAWNLLPRTDKQDAAYKNPDNDPRGLWKPSDLTRAEHRDRDFYPITTPSGKEVYPANGRSWSRPPQEIERLRMDNRLWFGPKGDAKPSLKRFLSEVQDGIVSKAIWFRDEVGDNEEAKKEIKDLNDQDIFATPKPERLIERVLRIATNPNDLVLDSFAGSGTTGAVAHKMGRRWIMIELGEHCQTHIVPRLKKVIDGENQGGISKVVNWQGGGGFRYFRLAPSLLKKDTWGNWIINQAYNAEMLSEAMCKHMGFQYAPSQQHFWMHGHSSETDFIYVTTGSLSGDQLKVISDEVGSTRTLLICCKAFMVSDNKTCEVLKTSQVLNPFANLTLKKIPQAILNKCEWDHDDYSFSLNVLADDDDSETCEVLETSQVLADVQISDNKDE